MWHGIVCALALLAAPGSGPGGQGESLLGEPVERPTGQPEQRTYGFLEAAPTARIEEPGSFVLRFRTVEETPPAIVYIGLTTRAEELAFPRYRSSVVEPGEPSSWTRDHAIPVDFRGLLERMPVTPHDPLIQWRAEVWMPSKRSSRFVEGRVYYDPRTLDDTVNITFGPIVDQVTETSAVISWECDRPSAGAVLIAGEQVESDAVGTRHEVPVTGLLKGTRYRYRATSGRTLSRQSAFRTAGGDRFRFAAMVDSREGVGGGLRNFGGTEAQALRSLVSHAYYQGAAFLLFAGDLVNGYTTSATDFELQLDAHRRAIEAFAARVPVFEGMGNHEACVDYWRVDGARVFLDQEGEHGAEAIFERKYVNPRNGPPNEGPGTPTYAENVYRFDWGNARFFVLNNNYWWSSDPVRYGGNLEGYVLPRQLAWLRKEVLRADRDKSIDHLFFAAQEPPFPNGGHADDAMWYEGGDTNGDGAVDERDVPIVENRNDLWSIVASSPKTIAFITGDEHSYNRLLITPDLPVGHRRGSDGEERAFAHPVWQITSGGAGAPWYDRRTDLPWSEHVETYSTQPHYALFRVEDRRVVLEVFSQTGQRLDAAVLRAGRKNVGR